MHTSVAALAQYPDDQFDDFCRDILQTLPRADQRRSGRSYLYGLLNCPPRKTIRRMAATSPLCRSEQSLQQFVNQSPWDHEPMRQRLMHRLVETLRPAAWVIDEMAFPKHGRYSAAVERQYIRSLERVSNCQLSVVVALATDDFTVPVNWRLVVPESWGRDEERRARARVPDLETPRPYWQYQIEVLDDMALDWGMPVAPVLVDARNLPTADALLTALDDRGMPYLAQVSSGLGCWHTPQPGPPQPGNRWWRGSVRDLATTVADHPRSTVSWHHADRDHILRSQFLQLPVRPLGNDQRTGRPVATMPGPARQLLVEWPLAKPQPRGYWITNMTDRPLPELVTLAKRRSGSSAQLESFAEQFGLRDYEGRTFSGWHHHVTLVTAAYVFHVLHQLRDGQSRARQAA